MYCCSSWESELHMDRRPVIRADGKDCPAEPRNEVPGKQAPDTMRERAKEIEKLLEDQKHHREDDADA
jgi:hypothetical protein